MVVLLIMWLNFKTVVSWRAVDGKKWPKYARKLIKNIDFMIDVNKLPAKLRYRRRLRAGGGRTGWCHARAEFVRESDSLGTRWAFLSTTPGRRVGEGRDSERPISGFRFKSAPKSNRP